MEFEAKEELPQSLYVIKLYGNPFVDQQNAQIAEKKGKKSQYYYRKAVVLQCPLLEDLDKISVVAAEKMVAKNLIPEAAVNLDQLLADLVSDRAKQESMARVEEELRKEAQRDAGVSSKEAMEQNLDEFAKCSELDEM